MTTELPSAPGQAATARIGIWVLGDQLDPAQSALAAHRPEAVRVLLLESTSVLHRHRYHQQKLVLLWSAMRHFAAELRQAGWTVDYQECEAFGPALASWLEAHQLQELHLMEPAERPFRQAIERLTLPAPLHWHPSNAFLWSREAFAAWARPYKQLRLELFYREGRRRFGVLMDPAAEPAGSQPLGGQWNYDHDNRKPWPGTPALPPDARPTHDHSALWATIDRKSVV